MGEIGIWYSYKYNTGINIKWLHTHIEKKDNTKIYVYCLCVGKVDEIV